MSSTDERVVYRTCPLCEATCGLEITVTDGAVRRIRGDADDVFSGGFVCPKGTTLGHLHEDPDRLRSPLARTGTDDEGAPVFEEISWDEAFRRIADGLGAVLEAGDRNALALYLGNPNVHTLAGSIYNRPLIQAAGTQNLYSASTVDQMPKHVSAGLMFGSAVTIPVPDLDRTDYLLMLGANPWASNGSLCTAPDFPGRLEALQQRGGRLVVVDPRLSRTAKEADEHLPIRPGGDAAWLCSLLHVLVRNDLVSLGRLADHVAGVDELAAAVEPFSPDAVADITAVEPKVTERVARELAAAPTAAVYGRIGTHTVRFGTVASWAVDAINTLIGSLDEPGGAMFALSATGRPVPDAPGGRGFSLGRWRSRVRDLPEARGELPVATLPDEILTEGPGRVRALVTVAGNPALSCPDSQRMEEAFASLDFMVSVDIYRNETTRFADVILPAPSALERSHYDLAFATLAVRNVANWSPPVFATDAPSESDVLARLALILSGAGPDADPAMVHDLVIDTVLTGATGRPDSAVTGRDPAELRELLTGETPEDRVVDAMLRLGPYGDGFGAFPEGLSLAVLQDHPHGVDLGPLTRQLPNGLRTPSGKVELAPGPIVDDVGVLAGTLGDGAGDPDGLLLVGRRHLRSNNSWMHNVRVLVKGADRCTLQIHPDDAARRGLADGDTASVTSAAGSVDATVEVTDEIMPGVVSLPHGWGHDRPGTVMQIARDRPGVNSNVLTDAGVVDPLSGNTALNAIPVTVTA